MESSERAVIRLTEAHTEHTEAGPVEWVPLLDWLRERITEINKRGNGAGGQGVPLNNDALEILNHIERRYRMLCEAAYIAPGNNLNYGVRNVWATLKADRAGGRLGDTEWEAIEAEFPEWVQRIEGEQERPHKMELTVPCPSCGNRWVVDHDGDEKRKPAVVIEYAAGRAPVAECRAPACEALWVGWNQVAGLGFMLGADQNMEVLAACGIDLRDMLAS